MDAELKGTAKAEAAQRGTKVYGQSSRCAGETQGETTGQTDKEFGRRDLARAAPAVRWERANPNVRSGTERTRRGKQTKSIQRTQGSDGKMMRSQGPKRTAPDEDKESRLKQTIKY